MTAPLSATEDSPATVCPAILVDASFESEKERDLVCDGADRARAFFKSHGIRPKRRIRLRLLENEMENHGAHIGLYDASRDQIDLLSFEQARRQTDGNSLFGMPMDEPLYVSVVVHEVAHAIAGQNLAIRPKSLIAHEYIAYVAQLSAMDPGTRSEVLNRYHRPAFENVEEMSSIYYELDPSGFGVKAYRHYQGLADQSRFIHGLLSGDIRPPPLDEEWQ